MLPCPRLQQISKGPLSPVCRQHTTEEGLYVMGISRHRIKMVRRFHVPGHTAYRNLRHCARQHGPRRKKAQQQENVPPHAKKSRSNGSPNALPTAGLVLRYETGCFFVAARIILRCRGPPPLSDFQNQTKEVVP